MHSELTGDLAGATKKAKQTECKDRITDTRCTHFLLGSESGNTLSEQVLNLMSSTFESSANSSNQRLYEPPH